MDFEQAAGQEQSITNQFTLDAGNDDGSAFIGLHVNTEHVVTCTNARDAVVEYRARNFMQEVCLYVPFWFVEWILC